MGYTKQVYDRALQELERRRQTAREEHLARKAEIYEKIPAVRALEQEMAAQAATVAKVVLASPSEADALIRGLGEENLALQRRRADLLTEAGYSPDYLQEKHTCEACGDTGWKSTRMCACYQELLRQEAYSQLTRRTPLEQSSFDSFNLSFYPDQAMDDSGIVPRKRMGEILEVCRQYARLFSRDSESLLLLGNTGLGKTHLSLAIAAAVTDLGYGVVYTPVQRLMDLLEADKFSRGEGRDQYLDSVAHVLECDLLVLDDLGTEFATSFTASVLYNIINSRLAEGSPTIISTNLSLAGIEEKYAQRMVSRMVCGYKVLRFCGRDIRYMKKKQSMG